MSFGIMHVWSDPRLCAALSLGGSFQALRSLEILISSLDVALRLPRIAAVAEGFGWVQGGANFNRFSQMRAAMREETTPKTGLF